MGSVVEVEVMGPLENDGSHPMSNGTVQYSLMVMECSFSC